MAFNLFPYSNFHKLNLDWVIKTIREAKEALDQAAQIVTNYESRLSSMESSVQALTTATGNLQTAVNTHTSQIQANTTAINTLTLQVTQAVSNASEALETATEAEQNVALLAQLAHQASQNASEALTNSSTALTAATAASSETTRLQREKLDKQGADALEVLGVTGNTDSAEYPFYIKKTGTNEDYEMVEAKTISRGILAIHSESRSGSGVSLGDVILRGINSPTEYNDAANKVYVDTKMPKTNPIGTGTLIMNAATMDDGLVLQDTVLTGVKFKASLGGLSLVSMSAGSEQPSQRVQISGVANPTANNDAANKGYVDGIISDRFRKLVVNVFPYASTTDQNKVHYARAFDITPTYQAEGFNAMREQLAALVGVGPEGSASIRPITVSIEIHAYNGEPSKTPAFSDLLQVMPATYDLTGFPSSQSGSESGLVINVRGGAALPGSSSSPTIPNFTGDMFPAVCFMITSENTIEWFNWFEV